MTIIDRLEELIWHGSMNSEDAEEALKYLASLQDLYVCSQQLCSDLKHRGVFCDYKAAEELTEAIRSITDGPPRRVEVTVSFLARGDLSDVANLVQENLRPISEFKNLLVMSSKNEE